MKVLLLLALLVGTPAVAHETEHYFPEVFEPTISADAFLTETVNHGYVTCYGKHQCILNYPIEVQQGRMVVPDPTQHFYRYPYNEMVTVW